MSKPDPIIAALADAVRLYDILEEAYKLANSLYDRLNAPENEWHRIGDGISEPQFLVEHEIVALARVATKPRVQS